MVDQPRQSKGSHVARVVGLQGHTLQLNTRPRRALAVSLTLWLLKKRSVHV